MTPDAFSDAHASLLRAAKGHDTGVYEDWLLLHRPLVAVAQKFGVVCDSGDGDFYHPGDWFTSIVDGFALLTAAPISKIRLVDFQQVLARRSPAALMTLGKR